MPPLPARLLLAITLSWALAGCRQAAEAEPAAAPAADGTATRAIALPADPRARAEAALADWMASRKLTQAPAYRHASVDLDEDGQDDLLLLLDDPGWCSGGGCTLLVFQATPEGFTLVSQAGMAQPPIAVGESSHGGWRDLLVAVGGAGGTVDTVVLQHDGIGYPEDPSLMALTAPEAMPRATTVIQ